MISPGSGGIVVDTCVWIAYFRGGDDGLKVRFNAYLDHRQVVLHQVVRAELLSGVRESEIFKLERALSPLHRLVPENSTWELIEDYIKIATKNGLRFGIMDLLIAASAKENSCSVWSLDKDFEVMGGLGIIEVVD